MRDQLNGQLYDIWKTDCDAYEHCIFPADEREPYSGYDDEHFVGVSNMVEDVGVYKPLSAKYTY